MINLYESMGLNAQPLDQQSKLATDCAACMFSEKTQSSFSNFNHYVSHYKVECIGSFGRALFASFETHCVVSLCKTLSGVFSWFNPGRSEIITLYD